MLYDIGLYVILLFVAVIYREAPTVFDNLGYKYGKHLAPTLIKDSFETSYGGRVIFRCNLHKKDEC